MMTTRGYLNFPEVCQELLQHSLIGGQRTDKAPNVTLIKVIKVLHCSWDASR